MKLDNITVRETRAELGDTTLTFYRISLIDTTAEVEKMPLYHSHFYYEFHLMLKGENRFMIHGQSVLAKEGTMVIIPPDTGHHPFSSRDSARELVLCLALEKRGKDSGEYAYFKRSLDLSCNKPLIISEGVSAVFQRLYDSFDESGLRGECLSRALAYEAIAYLFDEINHFKTNEIPHLHTVTKDDHNIALEMMVDDLRFSLGDIAASLGYSRRHTARLIQGRYGRSLLQIRHENQVSTVKKLLASTPPLPMAVIALQAGFQNVDAMTATFKKIEGTTPTDYRRRMSENGK